MRRRVVVVAACAAMALSPLLLLLLGERSNNPNYQGWASCRPGSWVTIRWQHGEAIEERSYVLLALTGTEARLRVTRKSDVGETVKELSYPAKLTAAELRSVPRPTSEREDEEEIEVGSSRVRCRRKESRYVQGASTAVYVWWYSDEIPGGLAKLVAGPEGAPTFVQVAVGWENK